MVRSFGNVGVLLLVGAIGSGAAEAGRRGPTSHVAGVMPVVVPIDRGAGWQVLRYGKIAPNQVSFSNSGLRITVARSAAPFVYPLPAPLHVHRLVVRGRLEGALRVSHEKQGERGFDDYAFRIGLVQIGDRRPGPFERLFAAPWLQKLLSLAPPNRGISKVCFFNVGLDPTQVGRRRQHPLNELLEEEIVTVPGEDGTFEIQVSPNAEARTAAVWLSSDGDDTQSEFSVVIERIELLAQAASS